MSMVVCNECAYCSPTPGGSLYCALTDHFVPNLGCEHGEPINKPKTNADRIRAMSDEELAMAEYIDRKAVGLTDFEIFMCNGNYKEAFKMLLDKIDSIPAADVAPVRHGKWIKPTKVPDSMLDECSLCGFDCGSYTFSYCPNCGAKMEVET